MSVTFQRASKKQAKARIALTGPAGSGKTYTALRLASGMGKKIAVIDTEHGSASKYSDEFDFDTLELSNFHPDRYIEAIQAAGAGGYDVVVVDSASHEWSGVGGCLELVDNASTRLKGNSYAAWKDVTPLHNRFIESIHQAPLHVIATFRSKMDYVQGERDGRKTVEKLGMAPITRDGAEYEFDIVIDLDLAHTGVVNKSRARVLADSVHKKPGAELAKTIVDWLSDGVEVKEVGTVPPPSPGQTNSGASSPTSSSGEIADMEALYLLGEKLPDKQNRLQIDALVRRHGYAAIKERLEKAVA